MSGMLYLMFHIVVVAELKFFNSEFDDKFSFDDIKFEDVQEFLARHSKFQSLIQELNELFGFYNFMFFFTLICTVICGVYFNVSAPPDTPGFLRLGTVALLIYMGSGLFLTCLVSSYVNQDVRKNHQRIFVFPKINAPIQ